MGWSNSGISPLWNLKQGDGRFETVSLPFDVSHGCHVVWCLHLKKDFTEDRFLFARHVCVTSLRQGVFRGWQTVLTSFLLALFAEPVMFSPVSMGTLLKDDDFCRIFQRHAWLVMSHFQRWCLGRVMPHIAYEAGFFTAADSCHWDQLWPFWPFELYGFSFSRWLGFSGGEA